MRALVLVPLLVIGGLLLLTELDRSADSSVRLVTMEATLAPTATPGLAEAGDGPGVQASPGTEPDPTSHRPVVLERFLCSNCHGLDSGWTLPSDHKDMKAQACEDCHAPAPNPPPVVIHHTPGDIATQELCTLCHGDGVQQAPLVIAPVVAEAQRCASCHSGDQRNKQPEDHEGLSVATCALCHETQSLIAEPVPHEVEGWEDCSFCHGSGRLTPLAGGHKEVPEDECVDCHQAVSTPPKVSLAMLDHSGASGGCVSCHDEGKLAPLPVSHEGRSELLCAVCHGAAVTEAPLAPHSLTPQGACTSCHAPETLPDRIDAHDRALDEACIACHRETPGGVPSIPHTLTDRSICTDCHTPGASGRRVGGLPAE